MSADEVYEWLDRLRMRRSDQDVVAATVTVAPLVVERLSRQQSMAPSELRELLDGQPVEVLLAAELVAPESSPVAQRVRAYLERVRDVRLEITGDDLRRAGVPESPALGRALEETLALKLDGFVESREEERKTALRLLGREVEASSD
jgi:tRNA nucleotidyltransferase (CCA-adding enzyme)